MPLCISNAKKKAYLNGFRHYTFVANPSHLRQWSGSRCLQWRVPKNLQKRRPWHLSPVPRWCHRLIVCDKMLWNDNDSDCFITVVGLYACQSSPAWIHSGDNNPFITVQPDQLGAQFNSIANRSTDRTGGNIRINIIKQEVDVRSFACGIQQAHLLDFLNSDSRHRDWMVFLIKNR